MWSACPLLKALCPPHEILIAARPRTELVRGDSRIAPFRHLIRALDILLMPIQKLTELVEELADCDPKERIELLLDYARSLPALPERFAGLQGPESRVEECQSPIFLFAEKTPEGVQWFADVPLEAPTVRGFVTLLWEGTQGASVDDLAALSYDLISQAGLKEILGMQRMNGLAGVLRRLKKIVVETAAS